MRCCTQLSPHTSAVEFILTPTSHTHTSTYAVEQIRTYKVSSATLDDAQLSDGKEVGQKDA